ncbi:hypothetical protein [Glacieibacterium frigidum]|uniref:Uncharacterized protein n=1 Tax=Glacieibacterium frigidum TaxID=2593303 RepID=A0A552UHJ3_9SPHN|nr:hypothetical protein [Glacieibacterium frigidum]TRW17692.1 hypothetical protein FMM06_05995 [Glacieibacterium frigidum]
MSFIPQQALEHVVLYKLFLVAQNSGQRLTNSAISTMFSFPVSSKRVEFATRSLYNSDLIDMRPNDGTVSIVDAGYKYVESGLSQADSYLQNYHRFGDDWLANLQIVIDGVPASDRIVSRDDNRGALQDIDDRVSEALEIIRTDNTVADALGEDRDVITGELNASKALISAGKFRFDRLIAVIAPALRYLADKFSGGAIAEVAKRLLALLLEIH